MCLAQYVNNYYDINEGEPELTTNASTFQSSFPSEDDNE